MGRHSRAEVVTAVVFVALVVGWMLASHVGVHVTSVAFAGLGLLLAAGALRVHDVAQQGSALVTFLWLAILFGISGQLNELGFMGYVGERLSLRVAGLPWVAAYAALVVL